MINYNPKKFEKPDEPHPTLGAGFWLSYPLDNGNRVSPFPRIYFQDLIPKPIEQDLEIDQKYAKVLCNLITNELLTFLNKNDIDIEESPIPPQYMGELASLVHDGKISTKTAKEVFQFMCEWEGSPKEIVAARNLEIDTNTSGLEKLIDELIANNPKQVEAYKLKPQALGWFIGQVMKNFKNADPAQISILLKSRL